MFTYTLDRANAIVRALSTCISVVSIRKVQAFLTMSSMSFVT